MKDLHKSVYISKCYRQSLVTVIASTKMSNDEIDESLRKGRLQIYTCQYCKRCKIV